jgi:hypothetical protein
LISAKRAGSTLINELELIEIPLLKRVCTWSNKHDNPTLVCLDRCLVNLAWDEVFPNTFLTALTRTASDHVPILLSASTTISRSTCFRFENSWARHAFKEQIVGTIDLQVHGASGKSFVKRLKNCRNTSRSWAKRIQLIAQLEMDTKILIDALDLLEETRPLSRQEAALRRLAIQGVRDIQTEKLTF